MAYFQGQKITFFTSFTDSASTPIIVGVSGVTLDVYRQDNSSRVTLLDDAIMSQDQIDLNIWYYNYTIPLNSPFSTYNVIYNAIFSGTQVQSTETFEIGIIGSGVPSFGGSTTAYGIIVDVSGTGINNSSISAIHSGNLAGAAISDPTGYFEMYVEPNNDYFLSINSQGYFSNQIKTFIPSGVASYNLGNIKLISNSVSYFGFGNNTYIQNSNNGNVMISDTFLVQDLDNPDLQYPVENLKIDIYTSDTVAGNPPVLTTYTTASGTFTAYLNEAKYIMEVNGQAWNGQKNSRFEYVYNIEVNSRWSGTVTPTGLNGPYGYQYLDTSKYSMITT